MKWLHKLGVNVMTMSPAKKDYGHHNYPPERIEKAIRWLKIHGNQKIGIVGASTTGTLAKRTGDMINSRKLFDDSEAVHPITEEEMIKIEKIHGTLLLIGAEDDVLWDTAKYIRRMEQRMKEHPHTCRLESVIYEHATHFVFPESMLKTMLPIGSGIFMKLAFQAARKYPKECQRARLDIDQRVRNAVAEWKSAERQIKIDREV